LVAARQAAEVAAGTGTPMYAVSANVLVSASPVDAAAFPASTATAIAADAAARPRVERCTHAWRMTALLVRGTATGFPFK